MPLRPEPPCAPPNPAKQSAPPPQSPNAAKPAAPAALAPSGAAAKPAVPATPSGSNATAKPPAPPATATLNVGKPAAPPPSAARPRTAAEMPARSAASSPAPPQPKGATAARAPKPLTSAALGRAANGAGVASAEAMPSEPKRIMPRSPRSALEPDMVDAPLRRSSSARHPLVVIGNAVITIFVLLAVVTGGVLFVGKQRFDAPGPLPQDKVVNVPHGSGIRDIADVLQREGLIAGEYQFSAHASLRDVVATIVDGKVIAHQIIIPEGLTSEQIVARLLQDDILTGNIKEIPREGSLLPDTYNFTRGITREQIIQRMQAAQERLIKEVWERHSPDLPLKTADQLVTLASLVEKETAKPDERTRVAAVFVNRLKQRMRLQSDPTIIYGLVGGKGTLGRAI